MSATQSIQKRSEWTEASTSGSFLRHVLVLTSGTAAGQAVLVLASPIITRLYTPAQLGSYAVYGSLLALLLVVCSLRYEQAIPIAESEQEAQALSKLGSLSILFTGLGVALLAWFGLAQTGGVVDGLADIARYWWALPLGVVAAGYYQLYSYRMIRGKSFEALAGARLTQNFGMAAGQIVLGVLALGGSVGLLLGDIGGRFAGSGMLVRFQHRARKRSTTVSSGAVESSGDVPSLREVASKFRRYPLFMTGAGLLNTSSSQLPVVIFASLFGGSVAGWFALSVRVLQTPVTVIGQAVAQVFLSQAAEDHREGRLSATVWSQINVLVSLSLPSFVLLGAVAPQVFGIVFGEDWSIAGVYTQYLVPWLFLVFVGSSLASVLLVTEKQKNEMAFQGAFLVGRLGAIAIGVLAQSATLAVAAFGAVSALLWLVYTLYLATASGVSVVKVLSLLARSALIAAALCAPIITLSVFSTSGSGVWWGGAVLSALLVAAWSYRQALALHRRPSET